MEAQLTAQQVIDAALIASSLKHYREGVTPIADQKTLNDLDRLISEYGKIGKTPLTYGASGQLEISKGSEGGGQAVNLNNVQR